MCVGYVCPKYYTGHAYCRKRFLPMSRIFICQIWQPSPRGVWREKECGSHREGQGPRELERKSRTRRSLAKQRSVPGLCPGRPALHVLRHRGSQESVPLRRVALPQRDTSAACRGEATLGLPCPEMTKMDGADAQSTT